MFKLTSAARLTCLGRAVRGQPPAVQSVAQQQRRQLWKRKQPQPPPDGDQFDRMAFNETNAKDLVAAADLFRRQEKTKETFLGGCRP